MDEFGENPVVSSGIYQSFKHQIFTLQSMLRFANTFADKAYRGYVHIAVHGAAFTLQELFYDLGYVDSDAIIIGVKEVLNNNTLID